MHAYLGIVMFLVLITTTMVEVIIPDITQDKRLYLNCSERLFFFLWRIFDSAILKPTFDHLPARVLHRHCSIIFYFLRRETFDAELRSFVEQVAIFFYKRLSSSRGRQGEGAMEHRGQEYLERGEASFKSYFEDHL